ncbi:8794_t:CDS:1, partial [Cetraspora pellucida]
LSCRNQTLTWRQLGNDSLVSEVYADAETNVSGSSLPFLRLYSTSNENEYFLILLSGLAKFSHL